MFPSGREVCEVLHQVRDRRDQRGHLGGGLARQ